ncbi:MAG: hypothetical protein ABL962_09285 [Fimbriimonadaceae bacterium]
MRKHASPDPVQKFLSVARTNGAVLFAFYTLLPISVPVAYFVNQPYVVVYALAVLIPMVSIAEANYHQAFRGVTHYVRNHPTRDGLDALAVWMARRAREGLWSESNQEIAKILIDHAPRLGVSRRPLLRLLREISWYLDFHRQASRELLTVLLRNAHRSVSPRDIANIEDSIKWLAKLKRAREEATEMMAQARSDP